MAPTLNFMRDGVAHKIECGKLVSLGRSSANDVVLPEPKASRSHALVRCLAGSDFYLIDLGSSNGTILNADRIVVPRLLADGDEIGIGSTVIVFHQPSEGSWDGEGDDTECGSTMTGTVQPDIMEVAVLVADIRGYTTMSERMEVGLLAKLLSRWFRSAGSIVERNNGVVDKFIGDAVMARWLVRDQNMGDVVLSTLRTAYELHLMTDQLCNESTGLPEPMRIGIGINTGKAAVGVMVSGVMQEYTVLGDSVNIAFRLESASKELKCDVVMNTKAFLQLKGLVPPRNFRACERSHKEIELKGKDERVAVCSLSFADLKGLVEGEPTM